MDRVNWRFLAMAVVSVVAGTADSLGAELAPRFSDSLVQSAVNIRSEDAWLNAENQDGQSTANAASHLAAQAQQNSEASPSDSKDQGVVAEAPSSTLEADRSHVASPTAGSAIEAAPPIGLPSETGAGYQGHFFPAIPIFSAPSTLNGSRYSVSTWNPACNGRSDVGWYSRWIARHGRSFSRSSCGSCKYRSGWPITRETCSSKNGCNSRTCGVLFPSIQHSEPCFNDFVSPVSNPVYFEDPRTLSEVRLLFINHELPTALGGNSVQSYMAQARVALSRRLSLIVTKNGFVYSQAPFLEPGFANVNAGLKYNLLRDPRAGYIVSSGLTYEIPLGSQRSLQGLGDGEFNFFLTGGTRLFASPNAHFISTGGMRQPLDQSSSSRIAYWSNHIDFRLPTRLPIYVLTEVNWWHYVNEGAGGGLLSLPEGGDLYNLGTVTPGSDLVTQAVGTRTKLRRNIEAGSAFEFPLGPNEAAFKERVTMDLIIRY